MDNVTQTVPSSSDLFQRFLFGLLRSFSGYQHLGMLEGMTIIVQDW
jgi:hypothetical protein